DTVEKASQLIDDVIRVHMSGGFEMRNWSCSSKEVLEMIPDNLRAGAEKQLPQEGHTEKILGITWSPTDDEFRFSCSVERINILTKGNSRPTKREVLRI